MYACTFSIYHGGTYLLFSNYQFYIQGNIGAASTVKEWRDFRDGKIYNGFPYAVWKPCQEPRIFTQLPC